MRASSAVADEVLIFMKINFMDFAIIYMLMFILRYVALECNGVPVMCVINCYMMLKYYKVVMLILFKLNNL
ncbi:hypothetical protein BK784_01350 [Bacillus thuringiensis serovar medellin]|uniref:Uncharacterized protein n=1 Tax=Bacillus thuringiensis subsp. medellin TaxID=79672 RepID=A0A9X6N7U4_BACTV|nr:hypothetical protein BK784_01350 [Bacillus thuringiensis serovar medellin]